MELTSDDDGRVFGRLFFVCVRSVYHGASRLLTLGNELRLLCFRECGECISQARSLGCTKNNVPELMSLLRLNFGYLKTLEVKHYNKAL
jgi:hypothetical protein